MPLPHNVSIPVFTEKICADSATCTTIGLIDDDPNGRTWPVRNGIMIVSS